LPPVGNTAKASAKIMFEIYREKQYDRRYRVCYFTELNDHNRDTELNRCLDGESFYSGYLAESARKEAREVIRGALGRLNEGEPMSPDDVERELEPYLA
jgi:hypothetical protein